MNQTQLQSSSKVRPAQSPEPVRAWVAVMSAMMGLLLVAFVVIGWQKMDGSSQEELTNPAVETRPVSASPKGGRSSAVPTTLGPKTVPAVPEPSPDAGQLVKTLAAVRPGTLTSDSAAAWQQNLTKLVNQGNEAVPALAEFFEKNEDVRFDLGPGPNLLGEPSLRIAFLKVLFDVPGPANVDLQKEVLKTATEPDEIALIARQLEKQEPGKHDGDIIEAAKEALEFAQSGKLPGRNTRPLVELLEKYAGLAGQ